MSKKQRECKRPRDSWMEYLDPTPVSIPLGFRRPPTIHEMLSAMVDTRISRMAQDRGFETAEEANDFDCGDDDFRSQYELTDLQEEVPIGRQPKQEKRPGGLGERVGADTAAGSSVQDPEPQGAAAASQEGDGSITE